MRGQINHIKIDLKGMVYKDVDWIQLISLVNTVIKF